VINFEEGDMALRFLAIDPATGKGSCPALFVDEQTGDLLFQGWTETDPTTVNEAAAHARSQVTRPWSGFLAGCATPLGRHWMRPAPPFDELFASATTSAVHLEMRDTYTPGDPLYLRWLAGDGIDIAGEEREWYDLVQTTVARGVHMRRARIVSEPLADFIRFEYELTPPLNLAAGDQVRWLPRRRATDIALPGNDFWVIDNRLARINHFTGDGEILDGEITDEPAVVKLCASAFEAVWERAIPHKEYRPT